MNAEIIRYVTVHWVRFPQVVLHDPLPVSDRLHGCLWWRFGVTGGPMDAEGNRPPTNVWCGLGLFGDRESAESNLERPESYLSVFPPPTESWHALLLPVTFRGVWNYNNGPNAELRFATEAADPGGPLFVITTGGFDVGPNFDRSRLVNFRGYSDRVRAMLPTAPARVASEYFSPTPADDTITMSLWPSDAAMTKTMYGPGVHRQEIDRFKREKTLDRTSFTRLRVLRTLGRWNGLDLLDIARTQPT